MRSTIVGGEDVQQDFYDLTWAEQVQEINNFSFWYLQREIHILSDLPLFLPSVISYSRGGLSDLIFMILYAGLTTLYMTILKFSVQIILRVFDSIRLKSI